MAKPRRVVPGATYLLTRRTYQRTFRLRPHPVTNEIARYCIAWAAARFGLLVHVVILMSNHQHLVVTDLHGRLPDFLRELHRSMAKALNASQGQWENLWSAERASAVLLPTAADVLAKIGYSAANPVAAALVEKPELWPGVAHWQPGTSIVVQRPEVYFDPLGDAPKTVELRIVPLPGQSGDDAHWASRVGEAVAKAAAEARAEVRKQGLDFLGATKVMARSFLARAMRYEQKRRINPILAAKDAVVRKACLRMDRGFQRAYRAALTAWKDGDRSVAFPFGTWWMRVHHDAEVLPAPG